jgi:ATP-dependent DNA helicase DinG
VLFGLNSFMTGLDVQGDALRVVVLDKVPFTSPDDVLYAARCEAMDRAVTATYGLSGSKATFHREGSFFGRSVPEATLVMLQAIGRGIRTVDDEALLVVLDPRVNPVGGKPYGKKMIAALPNARRLENVVEAKSYLEELSNRRDN